ncbi:MAG: BMC domain-containing protein [Brasilonema octagenarum HA4186-MV1]|uniref:Microcompartment protein n=2 Tax=Brasilonema TaxID=383614 RepID=A0A856MCM1_9CYAN|nr:MULTISPECIES: BMC domain-containing protein [Brasilonema]MBW4593065.1 BMC domain-containing protein [Brasilonema angustatum HA4187-MV1]MBW4625368.1 BMC domain-containing protein [Brasilonema octagenarum HA4186-MV1]QDL14794.1 microcompartment protein [Brasilonema octagenarum UFV-E1]NMF66696.1 microcompartment protein [Brasilonema octagenarum UFV-OR1]QDL08438.1 microcompartment protein [Brasilonema sennae CENA114]
MEAYSQRSISNIQASRRRDTLSESALGLVSTRSFPAMVGTADMMLKTAGVHLIGYEKIGSGHCTAIVRGGIADVRLAVESGVQTAEQFGQLVSSLVIARPYPNLEVILPINSRLSALSQDSYNRLSNQAIGLVETRGFPALVGAADAMLKAADVQLAAYEKIGAGLCTAIIRGSVANVAVAVEAGMYEAERIGELNAVMVIPRPLEELEQTLPVASCWIEERQPLKLPINIKEQVAETELVELPDLTRLPLKMTEE